MTLTIELSPEKEAALKARAQALGLTVEQWLLQLAEQSGACDIEVTGFTQILASRENPSVGVRQAEPRPLGSG